MINTAIPYAEVAQAVAEGFIKSPKRLPSWLFYDETGDKIFQMIMRMPEYYLTSCEFEIFQACKDDLKQSFSSGGESFDLVELGAGDGFKTEVLLKYLCDSQTKFSYLPVDVSEGVLIQLKDRLKNTVPGLRVQTINKNYNDAIDALNLEDPCRKVYLFLGANIGNFSVSEAVEFMWEISKRMKEKDQILVGFDLKKDPRIIQAAYDDPHGITRDFNMNLLVRLNRELGANFKTDQFRHYPYYDPETGLTKSYLVSLKDQEVRLEVLDQTVHFRRWELIHTEVSQKYDVRMIEKLAADSGLEVARYFYDCRRYFCDVLLKKARPESSFTIK